MSAKKQTKSSKKPTNKQALSSIEKKLLECCRDRKPVLLYGQLSSDEHGDLINKVRNIYVSVYVKNNEYYNWRHIDCGTMSGEKVYKELVGNERNGALFNCDGLVTVDNCKSNNAKDDDMYMEIAKIIKEHCDRHKNKYGGRRKYEDGKHLKISVAYFTPRILVAPLKPTTFDWLVVYTKNYSNVPDDFKESFELISLESEKDKSGVEHILKTIKPRVSQGVKSKETVKVDSVHNLLINKDGKEEKITPIRIQILAVLYKEKGKLVTRKQMLADVWNNEYIYDRQITDHVSKIKKAFTGLGFEKEVVKKEIIETVSESRTTDGGYIFHSKIINLCFN